MVHAVRIKPGGAVTYSARYVDTLRLQEVEQHTIHSQRCFVYANKLPAVERLRAFALTVCRTIPSTL
jgi:carotenoid cleavage dioxygenase-like enzyme